MCPNRSSGFTSRLDDGCEAFFDVLFRGRPGRNADAHGVAPAPEGWADPTYSAVLDALHELAHLLLGPARRHHLVQHDIVQDLETGVVEPLCEAARVRAAAIDQRLKTIASEEFHGRPNFDAASTAADFRREIAPDRKSTRLNS